MLVVFNDWQPTMANFGGQTLTILELVVMHHHNYIAGICETTGRCAQSPSWNGTCWARNTTRLHTHLSEGKYSPSIIPSPTSTCTHTHTRTHVHIHTHHPLSLSCSYSLTREKMSSEIHEVCTLTRITGNDIQFQPTKVVKNLFPTM